MIESFDKKYLALQFRLKIHRIYGMEFQNFFTEIMGIAFPDFISIRPYGNKGDGGNDGYIPKLGKYFQVYSPIDPATKNLEAANKMSGDFQKLKQSEWASISEIKEYFFVFNDNYLGSDFNFELLKTKLEKENPSIKFGLFTPKHLEEIFFTIPENEIALLGFDLDRRNTLKLLNQLIINLEIELDKGYAYSVIKNLNDIREISNNLGNEQILNEIEVLEARALFKTEEFEEAIKKFNSIIHSSPDCIKTYLYLAEMYLAIGEFDENQRLINKAKLIDCNYWLLKLQELLRDINLGKKITFSDIKIDTFPSESRLKADFYRIYSSFLLNSGEIDEAENFINNAIKLNPKKLANYDVKFAIEYSRCLAEKNPTTKKEKFLALKNNYAIIESNYINGGLTNKKQIVLIKYRTALILYFQNHHKDSSKIIKEILELYKDLHFDSLVDTIFVDILAIFKMDYQNIAQMILYFTNSKKKISIPLAKNFFLQLLESDRITDEEINFYRNQGNEEFVKLINLLLDENYKEATQIIIQDPQFAAGVALITKSSVLSKEILGALPDNSMISKTKLEIILENDLGNIDLAFSKLKEIDLTQINHFDAISFLGIAKRKKAWEFVILFGEILEKEIHEDLPKVEVKLELFNANYELKRYKHAIEIGESILRTSNYFNLLDKNNKDKLLSYLIGILVDLQEEEFLNKARDLSLEFKEDLICFQSNALITSNVFLNTGEFKLALDFIIRGILFTGRPSPENYANLIMVFNELGNANFIDLTNHETVQNGHFIKFQNENEWYFIGEGNSLDAFSFNLDMQNVIIGKKHGEIISIERQYSNKKENKVIEYIFPIEKYIMWKCYHFFQVLSEKGLWDKGISIETPTNEEGEIDFNNFIAIIKNDFSKGDQLFETYCENNIPLSLLAVSQGGLINSIGKIINEQRGYIRCSSGELNEFENQKNVAKNVLDYNNPFYLDGSSAWILAESGILEEIFHYIPNLKVPQSVINLLYEFKRKLKVSHGHVGNVSFVNGKISYSEIDKDHYKKVSDKISNAIRLLEANNENISIISDATKTDTYSEKNGLDYLSDATILSQRESIPIWTDDYIHLHVNSLETGKKIPEYFSTAAFFKNLYELKKISHEKYLDLFSILTFYRFRFLSISVLEIEKAIWGDKVIKVENVNGVDKLNLPFTLSEDYGVDPKQSLIIITEFLFKTLNDNSVSVASFSRISSKIYLFILPISLNFPFIF